MVVINNPNAAVAVKSDILSVYISYKNKFYVVIKLYKKILLFKYYNLIKIIKKKSLTNVKPGDGEPYF